MKTRPAPGELGRRVLPAPRAPGVPRLGARGGRFADGLCRREGPVDFQVHGDRVLQSRSRGERWLANLFAYLSGRLPGGAPGRRRGRSDVATARRLPARGVSRRVPSFEGIAEATFRPPAPCLARVLRPDGVVFRCSDPLGHAQRGRELRVSVGLAGCGSSKSLRCYRLFIHIEPWPTPSSLPSGSRKPTARTSTRSRTSWDSPRPTWFG